MRTAPITTTAPSLPATGPEKLLSVADVAVANAQTERVADLLGEFTQQGDFGDIRVIVTDESVYCCSDGSEGWNGWIGDDPTGQVHASGLDHHADPQAVADWIRSRRGPRPSTLGFAEFCDVADGRIRSVAWALRDLGARWENLGGSVSAVVIPGVGVASVYPPGECDPGTEGRWGFEDEHGAFIESDLNVDDGPKPVAVWLRQETDKRTGVVPEAPLLYGEVAEKIAPAQEGTA